MGKEEDESVETAEEKKSEGLQRDEGNERREEALLAPSDVRLARVLVARDSSHLGKS